MGVRTVITGQIAAILIIFSLGLPTSSDAVVFWDDSFEYANQATMANAWDGASCAGDNTILAPTTAKPRTGGKSLQEHFTGIAPNYEGGGSCFFGGRQFPRTQSMFTRFYMYLTDHAGTGDFLVGSPATKITLQFGNGHPISAWLVMFGARTLSYAVQHRSGNAENYITGGSIPQESWVCVESEMTMNSGYGVPDGILRVWINGAQVLNRTNVALLESVDIERPGLNTVRLYTQNGFGRIYYDDHAVGNTRIGCGASPASPAGDLTPPAAPLGVTVR